MMNLILGVLIGVAGTVLVQKSKTGLDIKWFSWLLFVLAAALVVLGFDIYTGSIIEHEMQAGWMGLGFSAVAAVIFVVAGWRFGVTAQK